LKTYTYACVHLWGPVEQIGRVKRRAACRNCTEVRTTTDGRPFPGTLAEARESWAAALHNLRGAARVVLTTRQGFVNALPGPLYRRLPAFAQRWLLGS
jgi:hypothetical protein